MKTFWTIFWRIILLLIVLIWPIGGDPTNPWDE